VNGLRQNKTVESAIGFVLLGSLVFIFGGVMFPGEKAGKLIR